MGAILPRSAPGKQPAFFISRQAMFISPRRESDPAQKKHKQHCWECRRHRLVCDFTRPKCQRCSANGIACPGYDDAKPLLWLEPNRSTRKRRSRSDREEKMMVEKAIAPRIQNIQLRTDISAVFEAAEYCKLTETDNTCIYPETLPICDLGPNPHVYRLSPIHLQNVPQRPDHVRLAFVCMILSHRINRTRDDPQSHALGVTLYRYRDLAIRSLREHIIAGDQGNRDIIIASVIAFLLADAQQDGLRNWQWHLEGARKLIKLRGGIHALAKIQPLEQLLCCFIFLAVIGNTTSPASDLTMAASHLADLDFIVTLNSNPIFPIQLCPPVLLGEIIKINHVRMRATTEGGRPDILHEAYALLNSIDSFSAEKWASTKPSSNEEWELAGNTYQAAVALYCISSLQSLSVLPRVRSVTRTQCLYGFLKQALSSPRLNRTLLWPLVVLGMDAVRGSIAMRGFVVKQLAEMSRKAGTHVPLTAIHVLQEFWKSGETAWDACFNRPYAFVTQIALNTRPIRT
ncbi:hypothetical protein MW887_003099 [Aspergillus wentii]|nr:hypothetical protein MW887_003099 [Aspergillus wentii]